MSSYGGGGGGGRYNSQSQSYAPSAPELPPYSNTPPPPPQPSNYQQHQNPIYTSQIISHTHSPSNYQQHQNPNYAPQSSSHPYSPPAPSNYQQYQTPSSPPAPSNYGYQQLSSSSSSSAYPPPPPPHSVMSSSGYSDFPPGTNEDVIRSFQMVDRDRSGFIDDRELQQALSSSFHSFNLRTIRLLMFLFKHPNDSLRIGPKEFAALWNCLGHWRGIFERYDKDRSGKIDPLELRDALYGIGYTVPGSVLQLLLSKYGDGSGRRVELGFDSFVECGMIIKGLTDKFKEKDRRYTGSATISYDDFMSMIIPFLISYD